MHAGKSYEETCPLHSFAPLVCLPTAGARVFRGAAFTRCTAPTRPSRGQYATGRADAALRAVCRCDAISALSFIAMGPQCAARARRMSGQKRPKNGHYGQICAIKMT